MRGSVVTGGDVSGAGLCSGTLPRLPTRRAPTIVVGDVWLGNAGDAAIALATRASLARLGHTRVAFCCHHRHAVPGRYAALAPRAPLETLVDPGSERLSAADRAEAGRLARHVRRARLVVAAGGGYLFEHYGPAFRLDVFERLLDDGRRLAFEAQSIGRFRSRELRARLARILAAAEVVLVRDEPSLRAVQELGVRENVRRTADSAVLLRPPEPAPRRRRDAVLVCVSAHPWARGDGALAVGEAALEGLARGLAGALARGVVTSVTLASTVQGLGGVPWLEDDTGVAERLAAALPAGRATVVRGYLTPDEYLRLAAAHGVVVSMRMHGAILGMVAGTPTLLANGADKARSLCADAGGGLAGLTEPERLGDVEAWLERALGDREALAAQEEALERLRALAAGNAGHLVAALG